MDRGVYQKVLERFCFEDFWFENVRIDVPSGFKTIKRDFDLIFFHRRKIVFFAKVPNKADHLETVVAMRSGLNSLCKKLFLSMNDFVVCGRNEDSFFILNKYNDQIRVFNVYNDGPEILLENIENELSFGPEVFSSEKMRVMRDLLTISAGVKERTCEWNNKRIAADGSVYIRKHGTWKEASQIHPETLYLMTVFGGIFGTHLFFQKKRAKGVLYLLTFGLFGFGWFFDSIEILFGIYRDPDGRYVAPLESKLLSLLILFIGFFVCFLFAILLKIFVSCLLSS